MCNASAIPIPGRAICDKASAANAILRITTKQPMRPAAIATEIERIRFSIMVYVILHGRSIDFGQKIRRENLSGRTETSALAGQAQHAIGILIHHRQLVRDEENG